MLGFVLKRLFTGVLVLICVVWIICAIIYLAPVDPARLTFGQRSDLGAIELKQKELGLDQPLWRQMTAYLNDISPISIYESIPENQQKYNYLSVVPIGNSALVVKKPFLRNSFQTGGRVSDILSHAIPQTAILAIFAILIALFFGLILGVVAALNQHNKIDQTILVISVLGISVPSFVSAIIISYLFAYTFGAFTGLNISGSFYELDLYGDQQLMWRNVLLPAIALGVRPIAIVTQLTRSSMLDVLSMDYIRTAKAKGLSSVKVIFKHALRNALNPVLTATSGWFASLLAGAVFVERVFVYNGLGNVLVDALINFDIPVILGATLFIAAVFIIINILVDILYSFLDPRVTV